MVEIFGKQYYIDIDEITSKCQIGGPIKNEDGSETHEINLFKYEILKLCTERTLSEYSDENDDNDKLLYKNDTSISFKIAFNTLIKYEILKELEEDE